MFLLYLMAAFDNVQRRPQWLTCICLHRSCGDMAKTAGPVEPKLAIGDGSDQSEVKKVAVKKVINWKSRLNVLINRRVDDLKVEN